MPQWEELERAAVNMKKMYEKARHAMTYSERSDMERDISVMSETAKRARDSYVRWLWTGR